jgi:hypothetical protein
LKHPFTVVISFVNGSSDRFPFKTFEAAWDFCRDRISYSGDRVRRVEIDEQDFGLRAIWDISWDSVSKAAGLAN